jgi:hypothetical protein
MCVIIDLHIYIYVYVYAHMHRWSEMSPGYVGTQKTP